MINWLVAVVNDPHFVGACVVGLPAMVGMLLGAALGYGAVTERQR